MINSLPPVNLHGSLGAYVRNESPVGIFFAESKPPL